MVSLLHILGYVAAAAACLFVTLSLASGLLWLSEIIEEHSRTSKATGIRATYAIITLHVLLWFFDSLPFPRIAFSIICHVVYLTNFTPAWPLISLKSTSFISSCVLVLADHFVWFFYFSERTHAHRQSVRTFGSTEWRKEDGRILTFMDIATFFGVCVWLIPLFLFLSLSANDNALPTSHGDDYPSTPKVVPPSLDNTPTHASSVFEAAQLSSHSSTLSTSQPSTIYQRLVMPVFSLLPQIRGRRSTSPRDADGLIAPRLQTGSRAGSPLASPITPGWNTPTPLSPSRPNRHEASIGYGKSTPPFISAPPMRRSATETLSSSSSMGRKGSPLALSSVDSQASAPGRRRVTGGPGSQKDE